MIYNNTTNDKITELALKTLCESSFLFFIRYVFKEYYGSPWRHMAHHQQIVDLLCAIERREVKNAVINIPPRYGKTQLAVILWTAWAFVRNPRAKFIHVSYSDDLALLASVSIRDLLKSDCIQRLWPIKMQDSADSKNLWLTTDGGGFKAGAAGGAVTGFGAGVSGWQVGDAFDGAIIIDDPLKVRDLHSQVEREKVNQNIAQTLHSRKNHKDVPIIIIMQRLHQDDASAFALSGGVMGEEFTHLKIPAINPEGQALDESIHTVEMLKAMQLADRMTFAGQYLQEPAPLDGALFKRHWFNVYHHQPSDIISIVHSWDTAYKADQLNDPSACTVWAVTPSGYYLLDVLVERMEYPEIRKAVIKMHERYPAQAILIEDKASGQSLIQELRTMASLPVISINTKSENKLVRASGVSGIVEAGKVFLPNKASWLADFESEILGFPNSKHDDQVDSVSQFLRWQCAKGDAIKNYNDLLDRL